MQKDTILSPVQMYIKEAANILYSFNIPLDAGVSARISFSKMPLKEEHLEAVKHWIDFFGEKLVEKKDLPAQTGNKD